MKKLNVPIVIFNEKHEKIQSINSEKVYSVNEIDSILKDVYETCHIRKHKKTITYINDVCTFDIETTNMGNKESGYYAFMYCWQVSLFGHVIFGRTWKEFILLIDKIREFFRLDSKKRVVFYIHNLAFEFQFMKDFFHIDELFAKDKRKPLYFVSDGIEFRCSYFLSNMNLQKFCENSDGCIHFKLEGEEFDYKKIRTPNTILSDYENSYRFNDVQGLYECIKSKLREDNVATIPLTSTGYVRRDYRNAMKSQKNRKLFNSIALTPELYKMCKKEFRGGDTHANRHKVGYILEKVYSRDITSSYPTSMELYYFPMSVFTRVEPKTHKEFNEMCTTYCCLFEIEIFGVCCKTNQPDPYIDIAHCTHMTDVINDNGRVLSASYLSLTINENDWECINMCYDMITYKVGKMFTAKRGKLPFELRNHLMDMFRDKTRLKDVAGYEYEYARKKNGVNSSYGMMVTAIDNDNIQYNSDSMEWCRESADLEKQLNRYYKSRNNFLSYQWGCWVTSQSRLALRKMLTLVGNDMVYCDTDSIKFVNEKHIKEFNDFNKYIISLCEKAQPKAYAVRNDKKEYLGIWDDDVKGGYYKRFRTWGAKKYAYELLDNSFHITVAGMSKKKGAQAFGSIENFIIDKNKAYENVGRTVAYYNNEKPHSITVNDCTFTTASNIAIVDTTYTLGVSTTYSELLEENLQEILNLGIDTLQ